MTPANQRNENGRFQSEHGLTSNDVLEEMEPLEPYTTGELADALNAPRRTIYNYLAELHEENKIRKKKPEPRRVIWIRGA
jgi:predicted transcriptional regulator